MPTIGNNQPITDPDSIADQVVCTVVTKEHLAQRKERLQDLDPVMKEQPNDNAKVIDEAMLRQFAMDNKMMRDTQNGLSDIRSHKADEGSDGVKLFAYIVQAAIFKKKNDPNQQGEPHFKIENDQHC